jgi:hypothetical protein
MKDNAGSKKEPIYCRDRNLKAGTHQPQTNEPAEPLSDRVLDKLAAEIRKSWIQERGQATSPKRGAGKFIQAKERLTRI